MSKNIDTEKEFLVSKNDILGEVAKYAVLLSPYHRPDNLEIVLDKLNNGLWERSDDLGFKNFTYRNLREYLEEKLNNIPEFLLWNARKNGNQGKYEFVCKYTHNPDPDDDFIDLDALIRNVVNSIVRLGTEVSISKILGEDELSEMGKSTT